MISRKLKKHVFCKAFAVSVLLCFFNLLALAQQHTITNFQPTAGSAGEIITINGTNFNGVTGVSIGGVAASSFTIVTSTRITAVIAAGAATGSISVTKTGATIPTQSLSGFTYLSLPTITRIVTDHGGFWSSNTTTNNSVQPDSAHHLLAFTYGNTTYSTGLKDNTLAANGLTYTAGNWKALPAILSGNSSGTSLFVATGAKMDGSLHTALFTSPAIKDLTLQSVLSDGLGGLNLGSGYTNLPATATSSFNIFNIVPSKITDNEPDLVVSQIADPPVGTIDVYQFLDASLNPVGNSIAQNLSIVPSFGTWLLDLFSVPSGVPVGTAKPSAANSTMTTRPIRLVAYKLSDFGITASNYSQVKYFRITPSGTSDVAFVSYNANAINVPPSITQNITATNNVICSTGGDAYLAVTAISAAGGSLTYSWEVSIDNGSTWNPITDNSSYSGSTTTGLTITNATAGYQYRATVTESISNYSSRSQVFTITTAAGSSLAGTLNPTSAISTCLNAISGTTALSVTPTGGTGTYSYQWLSSTSLNGVYSAIPGAIYSSYSFPLNSTGTYYYKVSIKSGCYSHLSSSSTVTVSGESITGVSNGIACSAGSVTLGATASGGTINWYSTNTSSTVLASGISYSTPSISSSTTYFVGVTSGGCTSVRVPVTASIASSLALDSNNTRITYATNVCSGAQSTVAVLTTSLSAGNYTVTYNVAGANTLTNATASLTASSGYGTFTTAALNNTGANTITLVSITVGSCPVSLTSANPYPITVSNGSPDVSNFSVSAGNGCSNSNAVATISSSSLPSGLYAVAYNVTGTNTVPSTTAQVNFTAGTPGTGTFQLPLLGSVGTNNVLTITSIALTSSPACSSSVNMSAQPFTNSLQPVVDAGFSRVMCASEVFKNIGTGATATNYSTLLWSTPDGSGTFANNTTSGALSNTTYTPSAADISAGSRLLTLMAVGNTGCGNAAQTVSLTIKSEFVWYGTTNINWNVPTNWECNEVPYSGANVRVVANPANQPQIQNDVVVGNIIFGANSNIDLNGYTFTISGPITGNATFKSDLNSSLAFSNTASGSYFFTSGNNHIKNLSVTGANATITQGADTMVVHGTVSPTAGTLNLNGKNVRLKSVALYTARIAAVTGTLSNATNVTVERFVPGKPGRRWSSMASPVNALLSTSWQQDIHITGAGSGAIPCATYTTNTQPGQYTNGFDATQTNASSFFQYSGGWQTITNTNSTYLTPGKGYYVNVRGDRNVYGCQLLQYLSNQTGNVPTYDATVKVTGTLTQGDFNVTASTTGYHFLGNPYACEIDFNAFYAQNSAKISQMYWLYDPANIGGNYMTWDGSNHAGARAGYNNHHIIASGQGFFVDVTSAGTLAFKENQKLTTYQKGGFKVTNLNDKVRINLFKSGDTLKQDDCLVIFDRDSITANTVLTVFDGKSINTGEAWVATTKGVHKLSIHKRYANYVQDTVDVLAYVAAAGTYQFVFSDMIVGGSIYLQDNLTNTLQNVSSNPSYSFSVSAAGNITGRFRLLFNTNSPLASEEIVLSARSVDNKAHLTWKATGEGIRKSYAVQSSEDGKAFYEIARIDAKPDDRNLRYEFADPLSLTAAKRYYRIKALSADGKSSFSKLVALSSNQDPLPSFHVYPNPVGNELNVNFTSHTSPGRARVYAVSGALLIEQSHEGEDFRINTSQLAKGAYLLELVTEDGGRTTQNFIK